MRLLAIEPRGFRNLDDARIELGPGLNMFWGPNAQGKTNLLEAVYTLANTKSFRTSAVRECVSFGRDEAIVRGEVARGEITREIQLRVTGQRKEFYVNGKREPVVDYLSNLDAIAFSFEDLDVVRGEPAARRRFLDRGIVGLKPTYLRTIATYNRVLRQKNRLLRAAVEAAEARPGRAAGLRETVESWNTQLVAAGGRIHRERTAYVGLLDDALHRNLFGEQMEVRYRSSFEGKGDLDDFEHLFADRLQFRFDAEAASGRALIGPHRDELEVRVGGREAARFGSAGQQRSALLILDLAQVSVYHSARDDYPVLLIDDIDAELDRDRIDRLLTHLEGKAQTLISTSKWDIATAYRDRTEIHSVRSGRVERAHGRQEERPQSE